MRPINVLAIMPGIIPSINILVIEPITHLHLIANVRLRLRLEYSTHPSDLEWADIVLFCRNTEPQFNWILDAIRFKKIPFIYLIDDNFFELPLDDAQGIYHRAEDRMKQLISYLSAASLVYTYSKPLEDNIRKFTNRVRFMDAPVNLKIIPSARPKRRTDIIKIAYTTSRYTEDGLASIFVKDLSRLLNDYQGKVEVQFWGAIPDELKSIKGVKFHSYTPNYSSYLRAFYRESFDIGLAPLRNDIFHRSKTNNKFREYGACWVAGVYSDVDVYTNCVTDGETGIIVSGREGEWYKAISRLIENEQLLDYIKQNAHAYVEKRYSLIRYNNIFWEDIQGLLHQDKPTIESAHLSLEERSRDADGSVFNLQRLIKIVARARKQGIYYFLKGIRDLVLLHYPYWKTIVQVEFVNLKSRFAQLRRWN